VALSNVPDKAAHSAKFHNQKPARQSKNKEYVADYRRKKMRDERAPKLRQFVHNLKLTPKDDWSSAMDAWNQNHSRKKTWKFESVAKFKWEYEWVRGQHLAV
jgi:hypothetical protein